MATVQQSIKTFLLATVLIVGLLFPSAGPAKDWPQYDMINCTVQGYVDVADMLSATPLTFTRFDTCNQLAVHSEHNMLVISSKHIDVLVVIPSRLLGTKMTFLYMWKGGSALVGTTYIPVLALEKQKA